MTHPTYTHPGANAAMLRMSQTRRVVVLCKRSLKAWQHTPLAVPIERNLLAALHEHAAAKLTLRMINERGGK